MKLKSIKKPIRLQNEKAAEENIQYKGITLTEEQTEAANNVCSGLDTKIQAPAGCLTGNTIVRLNRGGKGFSMTLARVYKQFNSISFKHLVKTRGKQIKCGVRGWDLLIPTMIRSYNHDKNQILLNKIEDVVYSGKKKVFLLVLEDGKKVEGTKNHKILTSSGWKKLGNLKKGDEVMVDSPHAYPLEKNTEKDNSYKYIWRVPFHPFANLTKWGEDTLTRRPEHILIYEAFLNNIGLNEYIELLRKGSKKLKHFKFIDSSKYHIHHKDENKDNNKLSNLEILTISDHKKKHSEETKRNFNQGIPKYVRVESIRYLGKRETFDICCQSPYNNFTANDIVVHNSGKTFLLEAASFKSQRRGIYLAFNKAIADEAGTRFPGNVQCRTAHSVAYRSVDPNLRGRIGKVNGSMVMDSIGKRTPVFLPTKASEGYQILDTIRNFCYSDSPKITIRHVPKLKGKWKGEELETIRFYLADQASILWDIMSDVNGNFPITHDVYLKVWALSKPDLGVDMVLYDEAQDGNPVILKVIADQRDAQKIYVGDKFQQIYSWRGAVNAMQNIKTDKEVFITQSFRFGDAIAEMANDILYAYNSPENIPPKIKGFKEKEAEVVKESNEEIPDALICRTNAGVISNVFKWLEKDISVYVQGGVRQTIQLLKGVEELKAGKRTWVPDLSLFENWGEVKEYADSESGGDMKSLVNMVDKYGVNSLIEALDNTCSSPKMAQMVLTTGHKSKGLEWDHVKLHNDFNPPDDEGKMPQGETNLLYVSATRALRKLDVSECYPCQDSFIKGQGEKIKKLFKEEIKREVRDLEKDYK